MAANRIIVGCPGNAEKRIEPGSRLRTELVPPAALTDATPAGLFENDLQPLRVDERACKLWEKAGRAASASHFLALSPPTRPGQSS